jgi:tRNA(Ser,Leu) C12 N-acetylase TAN1
MKAEELIEKIQKLPVSKRILVIERSIRLIRKEDEKDSMKKAADELYQEYVTDNELTAFTNLDFENFYETR